MSSPMSEVVPGYRRPASCLSLSTGCPSESVVKLPVEFPSVFTISVNANTSCPKCVSCSLVHLSVALSPDSAMVLKTAAQPHCSATASITIPYLYLEQPLPLFQNRSCCVFEKLSISIQKPSLIISKFMRQALPECLGRGKADTKCGLCAWPENKEDL